MDVLEFLRERARGKVKTTLNVRVTDQYQPVPEADVTVASPEGRRTARTGADGNAKFEDVKPAYYLVAAVHANYHYDQDSPSDLGVDVLAGTCAGANIQLQAEGAVTGEVRDVKGAPVANLELELTSLAALGKGSLRGTLNGPFFEAKTDADGKFSFDSISPGRYLLGSNIIGLNTSRVPPTYYPGLRSQDSALPLQVKPGEIVEHLLLTLPDFGGSREVQVCVLDEDGKPVPSAGVNTAHSSEENSARLGENLTTDQTGCVTALGFTRIRYEIHANLRPPGPDIKQTRFSDSILINPGEEPVHVILVLNRRFSFPKFTR